MLGGKGMANEIRGYSDEAVKMLSDDAFGVKKYVEGLCEFIKTCSTPMTISIQGDWGSGKTSMMNMIKEQITGSVHPVWFNTWQYSQFNMHDELTVSMLCALLAELECDKDTKDKIVGSLGKFFKKATKVAVSVAAQANGMKEIYDKVSDIVEPNTSDFAEEVKKLKDQFQDAVDSVLKTSGKNRVVIFVDDLDRLQPSKAVELLEVLKVFLDCEKCVYILAVDYGVVTQGIKQKFGDLVGEEKGRSFFDKIIQLPFKMPVAQYNINNYVKVAFEKMGIKDKSDKEIAEYVGLIQASIGCNPRSMKRLFNTYQLLNIIMKSNCEANAQKLLFATICMQMEFEKLYQYIASNCDTLNEDMLLNLANDNRGDVDNIYVNSELKESLRTTDEAELSRIANFMNLFNKATQLDAEENISEDEINNLKVVLSFSNITSVSIDKNTNAISDDDKVFRNINYYKILKPLNDKLGIFKFKKYQPGQGNRVHQYSDVFGLLHRKTKYTGLEYTFEYSVKTNYDNKLSRFEICLYNEKNEKGIKKFNEFFVVEPIKAVSLSENCMCKHINGCYIYENIIADFNAYTPENYVKEMERSIRIALRELEEFVKRRDEELKNSN